MTTCTRPEGCCCGGDLPEVRAGCFYHVPEPERTERAKAFVAANARSPVVYGVALSRKSGGGRYRLRDGRVFVLSVEECRSVSPRWDLGE